MGVPLRQTIRLMISAVPAWLVSPLTMASIPASNGPKLRMAFNVSVQKHHGIYNYPVLGTRP